MDRKNAIIYGLVGFLIGVLISVFVASNAVNRGNPGMMRMMGMQTSSAGNSTGMMGNIDAHFIEQMIPHHEDAIIMAKLAEQKATHPEVKQLAQNIIDSQGREIEQMKLWYKDWFGRELPTGKQVMQQHGMMSGGGMHMGMMGNETDLQKLEQTVVFDKAFIEEMIPHHQMAVMMANMLKNSTNREEMRKLADDIITAQNSEIDQMRQWYKDWGY